MDFINNLQDDFKNSLFKDVQALDIMMISLLVLPFFVTIFSFRIAKKFRQDEEGQTILSMRIKMFSLIVMALMAFLITQLG